MKKIILILFLSFMSLGVNAQQRASISFHIENKTYKTNQLVTLNGVIYKALGTTTETPSATAEDWSKLTDNEVVIPNFNLQQILDNGSNAIVPLANDYTLKTERYLTPESSEQSQGDQSIYTHYNDTYFDIRNKTKLKTGGYFELKSGYTSPDFSNYDEILDSIYMSIDVEGFKFRRRRSNSEFESAQGLPDDLRTETKTNDFFITGDGDLGKTQSTDGVTDYQYTYSLPDETGNIALTSDIFSGNYDDLSNKPTLDFLPLTGGTLTGVLNGTFANFSIINTLSMNVDRILPKTSGGSIIFASNPVGRPTYILHDDYFYFKSKSESTSGVKILAPDILDDNVNHELTLPLKDGTLALTDDLPIFKNDLGGFVINGRDEDNYGTAQYGAFDLSYNFNPSTTIGATGYYSTAFGSEITASGYGSFATGNKSIASGNYAVSMGNGNTSSGYGSASYGFENNSSGQYAFSAGVKNANAGFFGVSLGIGTINKGVANVVVGRANTDYTDTTGGSGNGGTERVFVVGNGTLTAGSPPDIATRSDALIVYQSGRITAPSYEISDITDDKDLTTKQYLDKLFTDHGLTIGEESIVKYQSGNAILNSNGNGFVITGGGFDVNVTNAVSINNGITVGGITTLDNIKLSNFDTAPSSSTDTGQPGDVRITQNYIYICVNVDSWKRTSLTTW